ncbi:hypothetical protein HDU93_001128 [Gonapodya sp. JEL0774]|nr:hypothetical protein HDU93_001128 [Gonapodya sp. JEL0774]
MSDQSIPGPAAFRRRASLGLSVNPASNSNPSHPNTPNAPTPPITRRYIPVDESASYSGKSGGSETTLRVATPQIESIIKPDVPAHGTELHGPGSGSSSNNMLKQALTKGEESPKTLSRATEAVEKQSDDVTLNAHTATGKLHHPPNHKDHHHDTRLVESQHFYGQEVYGKGVLSFSETGTQGTDSGREEDPQKSGKTRAPNHTGKVPIGSDGLVAEHRGGYFGVD